MADSNPIENDFLSQITSIIEKNLSNEQFGVSELADQANMSRSNLLRKVKKITNLSVSQLISQVRLQRGMEMLRKGALNVSEVSHQVGFSSTSYFIKCFREYYGYPPGEVGKKAEAELISKPTGTLPEGIADRNRNFTIAGVIGLVVLVVGFLGYYFWPTTRTNQIEKSIAVLPFINDSNDSTNVYLINGLMESTLNNLQQIKELKVISRTSAEKYRNTSKSIPEIAKELNVNYIVEGSGQKMGDRIVLNIQLIEASTDRHLWGNQYRKESKDIFELQREVANSIAQEIQAIITPDERSRIEKKPTDDLEAYDLFLKGQDFLSKAGTENLLKAVSYFDQATERDPDFAVAYARAVTAFYYLDAFQKEKKYTDKLSQHADKALLYDSKNAESLIAKGLDYMNQKQYSSAAPYLEKALEYNPNSSSAIGMLADFYCNYIPNTSKYLEYALKGIRLENSSPDSTITSYSYLRLGNALIQNGFVDEALKYIDVSLAYNSQNPFSRYVRAFILYAKNNDLPKTISLLREEYKNDSSRFDILQDIGKTNFYLRDYKAAYEADKLLRKIRETQKLDVYKNENLRIAVVAAMMGEKEKAEELAKSFKDYADNDHSIYKPLSLGVYYCYKGDYKKSLEHMNLFLKEENYQYWVVLFLDKDPILDPLKNNEEYKKVIAAINKKFWDGHQEIRKVLEEKGLL
jgi:TolB-like protein/AraC-like DNA-binding protein